MLTISKRNTEILSVKSLYFNKVIGNNILKINRYKSAVPNILKLICLSLRKFVSVGKDQSHTHYFPEGCQRLCNDESHLLHYIFVSVWHNSASLWCENRTRSRINCPAHTFLPEHELVRFHWEKHFHNDLTRLLPHLFAMKELISVTQIWRPILNLLKIAF